MSAFGKRDTCPGRIRCLRLLWSPSGQMSGKLAKNGLRVILVCSVSLLLSLQRLTICPYLLRDQLGFGIQSEMQTHTHTQFVFACACSVACLVLVHVVCLMISTVLTCRGCFQSFFWMCFFFYSACSLSPNLCGCACAGSVFSCGVLDV